MQSQKIISIKKNEILEQIELNKQPLIDNKKLLRAAHVKVDVEEKLNEVRKLLDEVEGGQSSRPIEAEVEKDR